MLEQRLLGAKSTKHDRGGKRALSVQINWCTCYMFNETPRFWGYVPSWNAAFWIFLLRLLQHFFFYSGKSKKYSIFIMRCEFSNIPQTNCKTIFFINISLAFFKDIFPHISFCWGKMYLKVLAFWSLYIYTYLVDNGVISVIKMLNLSFYAATSTQIKMWLKHQKVRLLNHCKRRAARQGRLNTTTQLSASRFKWGRNAATTFISAPRTVLIPTLQPPRIGTSQEYQQQSIIAHTLMSPVPRYEYWILTQDQNHSLWRAKASRAPVRLRSSVRSSATNTAAIESCQTEVNAGTEWVRYARLSAICLPVNIRNGALKLHGAAEKKISAPVPPLFRGASTCECRPLKISCEEQNETLIWSQHIRAEPIYALRTS